MGNGKKAGPEPIPHSEHREPGAEVLVPAGKSGGLEQCSLAYSPTASWLALTPSTGPRTLIPQEPVPVTSRICAIHRKGRLPQPDSTSVSSFIGIRPYDIVKEPFPPLSYSKLEEDRRKHKTKGPQEKPQGGGQNDIRGVQVLDLVVSGTGSSRVRPHSPGRPHLTA